VQTTTNVTTNVRCWGFNGSGQIGNGTAGFAVATPACAAPASPDCSKAAIGGTAVGIAVGGNHSCALLSTGVVKCWGSNTSGEIGTSTGMTGCTNTCTPTPQQVTLSGLGVAIAAGAKHTCAIVSSTTAPPGAVVKCWGANDVGQLGVGDMAPHPGVQTVLLPTGAVPVAIAAGGNHTCVVTAAYFVGATRTGNVFCWGANGSGQFGIGTVGNNGTPQVLGQWGFASIAAGGLSGDSNGHTCGITMRGVLYCWGQNKFGEMGDSTTMQRPSPVPVPL
jgi:alpha-tubulin suppressor-like RCC1 family protein